MSEFWAGFGWGMCPGVIIGAFVIELGRWKGRRDWLRMRNEH